MSEIKHDRRAFLRKIMGVSAGIGMVAMVGSLESCSQNNNTYSVTASKCTGCNKCLSVCGAGAISVSGGKASISSSKCVGCGKCARVCAQGAIS